MPSRQHPMRNQPRRLSPRTRPSDRPPPPRTRHPGRRERPSTRRSRPRLVAHNLAEAAPRRKRTSPPLLPRPPPRPGNRLPNRIRATTTSRGTSPGRSRSRNPPRNPRNPDRRPMRGRRSLASPIAGTISVRGSRACPPRGAPAPSSSTSPRTCGHSSTNWSPPRTYVAARPDRLRNGPRWHSPSSGKTSAVCGSRGRRGPASRPSAPRRPPGSGCRRRWHAPKTTPSRHAGPTHRRLSPGRWRRAMMRSSCSGRSST